MNPKVSRKHIIDIKKVRNNDFCKNNWVFPAFYHQFADILVHSSRSSQFNVGESGLRPNDCAGLSAASV